MTISGDAMRGGAKFAGCAAVTVFCVACVGLAHPDPYHLFLWACGGGTCVKLLWPNQDEGEAFIAWAGEKENDPPP